MFMGILHHFQRRSLISSLPDVLLRALSYIFSEISTYIIFILNSLPDITMEFFEKELLWSFLKKNYINIFFVTKFPCKILIAILLPHSWTGGRGSFDQVK